MSSSKLSMLATPSWGLIWTIPTCWCQRSCPSRWSLYLSLDLCVDHLSIIPTERRALQPCTTLCLALSSSDLESRHCILSMRRCGPMPHIMWFDYFLHVKLSWPGNACCWRNWSKRMIVEVILTGEWSASHEDMWGLMSPPNVPDHQEITCAANYRH